VPLLVLSTRVRAPIEVVFDLARSIDLHVASTSQTEERAVAGRTQGLIALGETVTWEARHFGVRQRLTVEITAFDRPTHFRDSMVSGAFRRFDHDHEFRPEGADTVMTDRFDYTAPLGPLGALADRLFLKAYMRRFLTVRNELIKRVAESGRADEFIGEPESVQKADRDGP